MTQNAAIRITTPMKVGDLHTPALVIDAAAFEHNIATMAAARPGARLRPHVKAHKSTELARQQHTAGHNSFCAATPRELIGMARAGLGADLLLANECIDSTRLQAMAAVQSSTTMVTVAVDSEITIDAAVAGGIRSVLIDVNVGLPRCGCAPDDAGRLATLARDRGLDVRGVMGYEGHVVGVEDRTTRTAQCNTAMALLAHAHDLVGGAIISAGGTGTFDISSLPNEIQAGSYALMDNAYGKLDIPFRQALFLLATVVSTNSKYSVADCGLKSLGMDHGNPVIDECEVWFCSDEHTTFAPTSPVSHKLFVTPAHVDPTAAYHEAFYVADGVGLDANVIDVWPIDLRGW